MAAIFMVGVYELTATLRTVINKTYSESIFFVTLQSINRKTMTKQENITTKLLPKEVVDQNEAALDMVNFYARISDIIERTHIAMGEKGSYKIANSSTKNQKLNTNVYASTH